MVAQTVSANAKFDTLTGLASGDTITINSGATLTVDSDTGWGQVAPIPGAITCDAASGGSLIVDATGVWEVPFTASSGNVPALAAVGANPVSAPSGASGELLGVFPATNNAPVSGRYVRVMCGYSAASAAALASLEVYDSTGALITGVTPSMSSGTTQANLTDNNATVVATTTATAYPWFQLDLGSVKSIGEVRFGIASNSATNAPFRMLVVVSENPITASFAQVPATAGLLFAAMSGAAGTRHRIFPAALRRGLGGPSAAGGDMPAAGYLKLRAKSGAFVAGETVTLPGGASVTISGPGQRSWLRFATSGNAQITGSGRAGTKVHFKGDWYDLGLTTGVAGQKILNPACGHEPPPFIEIETSPGTGEYTTFYVAPDNSITANTDASVSYATVVGYMQGEASFLIGQVPNGINQTVGGVQTAVLPPAGCRIRMPNLIVTNANATDLVLMTDLLNPGSVNMGLAGVVIYDKVAALGHVVNTSGAQGTDFIRSGFAGSVSITNGQNLDFDTITNGTTLTIWSAFNLTCCYGVTGRALLFNATPTIQQCTLEMAEVSQMNKANGNTTATYRNTSGYVEKSVNTLFTFDNTDLIIGQHIPLAGLDTAAKTITSSLYNGVNGAAYKISAVTRPNAYHSITAPLAFPGWNVKSTVRNVGSPDGPWGPGTLLPSLVSYNSPPGAVTMEWTNVWIDRATTLIGAQASNKSVLLRDVRVADWTGATPLAVASPNMKALGLRYPLGDAVGYPAAVNSSFHYGFSSDTAGWVALLGCKDEIATLTGSAAYDSNGTIYLGVGDTVTWVPTDSIWGMTGIGGTPVVSGTASVTTEVRVNGVWHTLDGATTVEHSPADMRLQVRITCTAAGTLTKLVIPTTTNTMDQNYTRRPVGTYVYQVTGLDPEGFAATPTWTGNLRYRFRNPVGDWYYVTAYTGDSVDLLLEPDTEYDLQIRSGGYTWVSTVWDTGDVKVFDARLVAEKDSTATPLYARPRLAASYACWEYDALNLRATVLNNTGADFYPDFASTYQALQDIITSPVNKVGATQLVWALTSPIRVNAQGNGIVRPVGNPLVFKLADASNGDVRLDFPYTDEATGQFPAGGAKPSASGFQIIPRQDDRWVAVELSGTMPSTAEIVAGVEASTVIAKSAQIAAVNRGVKRASLMVPHTEEV